MRPLRDFAALEASGALLLAGAAVVALVWANSPWTSSYETAWTAHLWIFDLRGWLNDGLMTLFFLVVGLEIKRELTDGHLATARAAVLPAAAALGGMVVPALLYLAIAGSTAPRGWAIPMATDIALAVGVLAVAGSRLPTSLRAFLLGLAIVDDVGAIIVIAVAYSHGVSWIWLVVGAGSVVGLVGLRKARVDVSWPYLAVGVLLWIALHRAGIHPTLAGVVVGLMMPPPVADTASLEDRLHPWTTYLVVPVFAVANAGIAVSAHSLRQAAGSAITWGIVAGLLLGKPLGVVLTTRLVVRSGAADAPSGADDRQLIGVGAAAGIGFTVALFITELALPDPAQRTDAKMAILAASAMSALISAVILTRRRTAPG